MMALWNIGTMGSGKMERSVIVKLLSAKIKKSMSSTFNSFVTIGKDASFTCNP
jgi:hypothetical protein